MQYCDVYIVCIFNDWRNEWSKDFLGWSGIGDVSYYTLTGEPGWSGAYYTDDNGNMIKPEKLQPNPDFFTSILWKNLMGRTVLDLKFGPFSNPIMQGTSLHANCAARFAANISGAITIAFSNTNVAYVDITAQILTILGVGFYPRVEYFLTSGDASNLTSRYVRLNGAVLSATSSLNGKFAESGSLILPRSSYGFVVFPQANSTACTYSI